MCVTAALLVTNRYQPVGRARTSCVPQSSGCARAAALTKGCTRLECAFPSESIAPGGRTPIDLVAALPELVQSVGRNLMTSDGGGRSRYECFTQVRQLFVIPGRPGARPSTKRSIHTSHLRADQRERAAVSGARTSGGGARPWSANQTG